MTGLFAGLATGNSINLDATARACASGPAGQSVVRHAGNPLVPADACVGGPHGPTTIDLTTDDEEIETYPAGFDSSGTLEVECFHSRAHLPGDQEALLIDTGARKGLTGSEWVDRVESMAVANGLAVVRQPTPEMKVRGVGKFPQVINEEAIVPGYLEDGDAMRCTLSIVPNSPLPALLGLDSMEAQDGIVDTRRTERKMYLGADARIVPGPKTKVLQLYPAESGHLMLPITNYPTSVKRGGTGSRRPTGRARSAPAPSHKTVTFQVDSTTTPDKPAATAAQPMQYQ